MNIGVSIQSVIRKQVWYPCTYGSIDTDEIWKPKSLGIQTPKAKEIGFYVHVPLCKGICKYCPFNKFNWTSSRAEQYITAVKKEIRLITSQPYFENVKIIAGFFGGGTPTSLSTDQLVDLVEWCYKHLNVTPDAEMSVEATPNTIDEEKLRALRDIGINRLSIGVQSFHPHILQIMGRAHKGQQSIRAIELAHKVGFEVVTIDLLYRVPGQTLSDWEKDLRQALELDLDHLTTFSLFLDPGTPLHNEITAGNTIPQPDEEMDLAMYQMGVDILSKADYSLYSLYDFARPGKECLHHAINWQAPQRDYVSFGPGAFSFINNGESSHIYCNFNPLDKYINSVSKGCPPVDFGKKLSNEEEMSRYMVLGVNFLRIPRAPFLERFGVDVTEIYDEEFRKLQSWDLIQIDENDITLTNKGKIFLANVSKMFFTENNKGMPHIIGVELQQEEGLSLKGLERDNR